MSSTSETGHAKNLANINPMYDLITQFGVTYNPSNPLIKLTGLATLRTQCQTAYNNYISAFTTYKADTNTRELLFEPLNQLITKVNDNIKTLALPQQTIDDVNAIVAKIHGTSKKAKKTETAKMVGPTEVGPVPETPIIIKTISTSQKSFDSMLANLDKLIKILGATPLYAPNETNIKVTGLQTLYTNLSAANLTAISSTNAANLMRNQRNLVFYAPNTGLYELMKKVKLYIRQLYGRNSAQYHMATAIKFSHLR